MLEIYSAYWSWSSMIFYLILGLMAVWGLNKAYDNTWSDENDDSGYVDRRILVISLIWTFFATFRVLAPGIGGTDAGGYAMFFQNCLDSEYTDWMEHVASDRGYKWLNVIIRSVTDNYHVLFALVYGFMAWTFMTFVKVFMPKQISYAPFLLTIYLYLVGFNTLRSHLGTAVLLLAAIALGEKKWIQACVWAALAFTMHKMMAVYALAIPFCWFFQQRKLKVYHVVALIFASSIVAGIIQPWFIQYTEEVDLSGAYGAYARMSLERDFMDNYWKIAFEQMVLGVAMVLLYKRTTAALDEEEDEEYAWRMRMIWLFCAFDMIMIPVAYIMNIWRAYEIFYMPRIVMWAWLIGLVLDRKPDKVRPLLNVGLLMFVAAWIIFRVYRTYAPASLMPYVFDWQALPFVN